MRNDETGGFMPNDPIRIMDLTGGDKGRGVLNEAVYAAVRAADNEDGAPVEALKLMARDADCLIHFNCTWREMKDAEALYEGSKLAGLT